MVVFCDLFNKKRAKIDTLSIPYVYRRYTSVSVYILFIIILLLLIINYLYYNLYYSYIIINFIYLIFFNKYGIIYSGR